MPAEIDVICPNCKQSVSATDFSYSTLTCSSCGHTFKLPNSHNVSSPEREFFIYIWSTIAWILYIPYLIITRPNSFSHSINKYPKSVPVIFLIEVWLFQISATAVISGLLISSNETIAPLHSFFGYQAAPVVGLVIVSIKYISVIGSAAIAIRFLTWRDKDLSIERQILSLVYCIVGSFTLISFFLTAIFLTALTLSLNDSNSTFPFLTYTYISASGLLLYIFFGYTFYKNIKIYNHQTRARSLFAAGLIWLLVYFIVYFIFTSFFNLFILPFLDFLL